MQFQLKSKCDFLPVAKNIQDYKAADLHKVSWDEKEKKHITSLLNL